MSEKQQRLAVSIIEFLRQSSADGTISADDVGSIDVAIQCIGESFGINLEDEESLNKLSIKPATLQSVFDVYLKTASKVGPGSSSSASAPPPVQPAQPSASDKEKAEKAKATGNSHMTAKRYDDAIASYSEAIALDPRNPIYYSNRAAAYSSKGDNLSAVGDAEEAIRVDPTYVKSYHRLGHAQYALSDFQAAADAFERGLKIEPENASLKAALSSAKARIVPEASEETSPAAQSTPQMPAGFGGMADMLRGMSGGGGGMPDLASLMNNPQLMSMAQQMAQNGGLANLMQNPAVANMMGRVQSGDLPAMDEIMSDPTMRSLAEQFGGMGGGAGQQ